MVSLKELRKQASEKLKETGNDSPLADIDYILSYVLGFSKSELIFGDKHLDCEQQRIFSSAFERLLSGEPVQYIAGGCEFMSLWFEVSSATLIPRADTEILVESVVDLCKERENLNIFEVGTGSGCIAVSLAHFLPQAEVLSVDISEEALAVAKRNSSRLGTESRCRFEKLDIMKELPELEKLPDVIVSNPPYIPDKDISGLEKKVKDFEPLSALIGGCDGLDFYRRIARDVPLAKGGILAFEVGIGQATDVAAIIKDRFRDIRLVRDLSGIERVVLGFLV